MMSESHDFIVMSIMITVMVISDRAGPQRLRGSAWDRQRHGGDHRSRWWVYRRGLGKGRDVDGGMAATEGSFCLRAEVQAYAPGTRGTRGRSWGGSGWRRRSWRR